MTMLPHFDTEHVTVWHGDCIDVMREMPDASVDAVVTDPPYGLGFMGHKWDTYTAETGRAKSEKHSFDHVGGNHNPVNSADQARTRRAEGHKFEAWCEEWAAEAFRLLKPGGHLLAFGGTRTFHRLAAGIEDAGFEIRDSIAWLYGSGFPKSLDVSKAIDKSRQDIDEIEQVRSFLDRVRVDRGLAVKAINQHFGFADNGGGLASTWTTNRTSRAIPTWQQWLNLKEWLGFGDEMDELVQSLESTRLEGTEAWKARPQAEHATRPGMATSWSNGVGWNGTAARGGSAVRDDAKPWQGWGTALKPAFEPIVVARKPLAGTVAANVLQHGTGALNIDASRIVATDPEAYAAKGASVVGLDSNRNGDAYGEWTGKRTDSTSQLGRWPANVILDASQAAALDQQSGVTRDGVAGANRGFQRGGYVGGTTPDAGLPDLGYGGEGGASRFFYTAKASTDERPSVDGIAHPTVKPVDLMRWLVRLVTPKGGVVLEPFAGSGTTVEAAVLEGFRCIAIEREADYLPLIMQRVSKPHAVGLDFGDWEDAS